MAAQSLPTMLTGTDDAKLSAPSSECVQYVFATDPQPGSSRRSYQAIWTLPDASTTTRGMQSSTPIRLSLTRSLLDHVCPPSVERTSTMSRWSRATPLPLGTQSRSEILYE